MDPEDGMEGLPSTLMPPVGAGVPCIQTTSAPLVGLPELGMGLGDASLDEVGVATTPLRPDEDDASVDT